MTDRLRDRVVRQWAPRLCVAALVPVAAWLSRGTLAVTDTLGDARVGLPPPVWQLAGLVVVGTVLAFVVKRGRLWLPLAACAFLILPWLPIALPPAVLVWTGPMTGILWIVMAVAIVRLAHDGRPAPRWPAALTDPRRAPLVAAGLAFLVYAGTAWSMRLVRPSGDEPHYLIITQSLLRDGDLQIENNHNDRDYVAYWNAELRPHFLTRGLNAQIYSVHAPGLPVLIAPAFALAGYPGVVVFLAMLSALSTALAWRAAQLVSTSAAAAWFAWAAVALTPPFLLLAAAIYPDAPAGWCAILVVYVFLRAHHARSDSAAAPSIAWCAAAGCALALLPWLHSRYAASSALLGVLTAWRLLSSPAGRSGALVVLAPPAVSAAAWLGFFYVIYGQPSPAAPYAQSLETQASFILTGLPALLFDQQFGLLPYAPVLAAAGAGLWCLLRGRNTRIVAMAVLAAAVPPLLMGGAFQMWWGGFVPPARFLVAGVPALAVPVALAWQAARSASGRALAAAALAISLATTLLIATVDRGAHAYNVRDGYATWLGWLNHAIVLQTGLPSYLRDPLATALTATAVWVGLLTLVWIVVRICEQRVSRDAAVGLVPAVVALAVCVGVGLTWQLAGDEPLDPSHSQIDLLSAMRDEPADRLFVLRSGHWLAGEAALARFDVGGQTRRGRVGLAATFLHLDRLPAGTYRLLTQRPAPVKFDVNVGRPAGPRGHRPVAALQLDGTPGAPPATFTLPVDVLDFRVTTDDNAQALGRLSVQPIALRRVRPLPGSATRAARYGRSAVFFLNEAVYPEPNGFWVRGEATAPFAVQTSDGATGVALFLRNGPFPNVVSVRIDGTAQDLSLKPGEERTIAVSPGSTDAAGIEVSSSALFRPRRVDPASTDLRPLGVWVEVR